MIPLWIGGVAACPSAPLATNPPSGLMILFPSCPLPTAGKGTLERQRDSTVWYRTDDSNQKPPSQASVDCLVR
jgi:hypothetical protein